MGMLRVLIHGNLVRDPEAGETKNGKPVTNFSVAVNQYQGPNLPEKTHYVRVSAYGTLGTVCLNALKKGQGVICWGKGDVHTWTDKTDGSARGSIDLVLEGWDFAGGKKEPAPEASAQMTEEEDEELPFD
ncbi:MAG: single-stranded DNA-binding protein [Clostridiales bacterium]|nr:single-stranded DNA-binding protein [Clostridiales bacterium]